MKLRNRCERNDNGKGGNQKDWTTEKWWQGLNFCCAQCCASSRLKAFVLEMDRMGWGRMFNMTALRKEKEFRVKVQCVWRQISWKGFNRSHRMRSPPMGKRRCRVQQDCRSLWNNTKLVIARCHQSASPLSFSNRWCFRMYQGALRMYQAIVA